ncbi:MAG: purine-nucleoside phosphorylase [Acidilobaceae archaeon]
MTLHLRVRPGTLARDVIACGDPARVDLLSSLLDEVRLLSSYRGFKVVEGFYKKRRIALATHGIGGPSAAIVFEELRMAGAERIVRLGSAGGLRRDAKVGGVVVATGAGYLQGGCALGSYAPGFCLSTSPDIELTYNIMKSFKEHNIEFVAGPVFSNDAFYMESKEFGEKLARLGFVAIEMETATLFALGFLRGFKTASVLVASNVLYEENFIGKLLSTEELAETYIKVGRALLEALVRTQ